LDDLEEFDGDPGLEDKLDGLPSARAMGDWLRDFSEEHLTGLNAYLTRQALGARKSLGNTSPVVIDMDSTAHEQAGKQMEGLAFNYDGKWCLDSLVAYDELGFSYGMELRPGNTFSAVGAPEMVRRIFGGFSYEQEKYFRADSAFCNEDVQRALLEKGVKFTITAHANMGWEREAEAITEWAPWEYSAEEIEQAKAKKRGLPIVELGRYLYQPGWSENIRFWVVIKRTWIEQEDLFGAGRWKYYAVMTNWNLLKHGLQEIVSHHAKRGNCENFIREEKYGFDLKHFPCQKLSANHAYGLVALLSHNFLRLVSLLYKPDKPHFSKKLRRRFVFIPGKLISHARQLIMKVPMRFRREVELIRQWTRAATSSTALARGT
jgi:hypothetical protein